MKFRYEIILYWSEEDQAFIAEVPDLPGCIADGETYQQALQYLEIIMKEWVEIAQKLKWTIPEPKQRPVTANN
jgi:predicted RNase H-like HicB family nuclease